MIKEPKNVDFYVLDKPWTEEERKEFSAYIKERKAKQQKARSGAGLPACCLPVT